MENCGYSLESITKRYYFGGSYLIIELFLKVKVQNGNIFCGVVKVSNKFLSMPDIPDIFSVNSR